MDPQPPQVYPVPITCPVCQTYIQSTIQDPNGWKDIYYTCSNHFEIKVYQQLYPKFWSIKIYFPKFDIIGYDIVIANNIIKLNHSWNINDLNLIIDEANQIYKYHNFL